MSCKVENCRADFRPYVTEAKLLDFVQDAFGLQLKDRSSVKELESYEDRNFLVKGCLHQTVCGDYAGQDEKVNELCCKEYVIKVLNPRDTYADGYVNASIKILEHLNYTVGEY